MSRYLAEVFHTEYVPDYEVTVTQRTDKKFYVSLCNPDAHALPTNRSTLDTCYGTLRFLLRPNSRQSRIYRSELSGIYVDCDLSLAGKSERAYLCYPSWDSNEDVAAPYPNHITEALAELFDCDEEALDAEEVFWVQQHLLDLLPVAAHIMQCHIRGMEQAAEPLIHIQLEPILPVAE